MAIGKIDEFGVLYIKRKNKFIMCECKNDGENVCRDTCPSFREPKEQVDDTILLEICDDYLYFEELIDERSE